MLSKSSNKAKKTKGNIVLAISLALIAGIISYWYLLVSQQQADEFLPASPLVTEAEKTVPIPPQEALDAAAGRASDSSISEMDQIVLDIVRKLQEEHDHEIHDLRFQLTLKSLRDDLIKSFPEQGAALFERILNMAFPELAQKILAFLAKLDIYDAWLLDNMLDINELSLAAQQEALWTKRYEMFGEDAKLIWDQQLSPEDERRESMRVTVEMLDSAEDLPMEERLYLLTAAFEENYSGTYENLVYDARGVLSQVFFGFSAVQKDLGALEPTERQGQIDEIRRSMGFTEQQIQELAERDQAREVRWQNGYAYMAARNELTSKYADGNAPEAELDLLREQFFKEEAPTIKKEETDLEFYRYERPRVYGRN